MEDFSYKAEESSQELFTWTSMMSVVDYEKELMRKRSQLLYQLQDPVIYREFMEFMSFSKSTRFVFILNLVYTIVFPPPIIVNLVFGSEKARILSVLEMVLISLAIVAGWLLYFSMKEDSFVRKYCELKTWKKLSDEVQSVLYLSLVLSMGLVMIRRTWIGECSSTEYLYSWTCNPNASSNGFPMDSAAILMIIPLLFSCVMRETRVGLILTAWLIVMFCLIFCSGMLLSTRSFVTLAFYGIVSIVIMLDSFKQYLLFYLLSRHLKKTIETNQKLADQNKATEMRHMIANVAHDLKTPLSSFMTGIDLIAADVSDLAHKLQMTPMVHTMPSIPTYSAEESGLSPSSLSAFTSGLQSCIANIRNTNAFMLMTINRCLDYTKASNGLKLVPKNETIDLAETLKMPLQCMTNIQQKIKICLMPYGEQGICSHVITDKQWLQENVLCLLSNAVKYSAGGEVVIKVTRLSRVEGAKLGEAVNRSLPTDKVCCKVEDEVITTDPDLGGRSPVSRFRSMRVGSLSGNWIREASRANLLAISDPSFISNLRLKISPKHNRVNPSNVGEEKTVNAFSPRRWRRSSSSASNEDRSVMSITPRWWKGSVANDNDSVQDRIDTKTEFGGDQSVAPNDLDTISEKSASEELMFEVIDTGIGISEEAMKTLFNPFKQTQRLAGGTGLGLYSLAKRIEAMRGKYGVHQRKDGKQGSVFWFTLPYKPDEVTAAHCTFIKEDTAISTKRFSNSESQPLQSEVNSSRVSNGHKFHLKPELSVLLAEDTPSIAKMTSMMLRRQHHQTAVAENGQIALDMLYKSDLESGIISEGRYDVVLMDLQMPVMDGLEATRRIRAHEREMGSKNKNYHHHQIVIGVSANSDHETMEEALKAGIDDFLPKPFSVDAFLTAVKNVQEKLSQQY